MTYHPAVNPLAFILATNDALVERSFQDVPDGDLWKRPTPHSNPMLWIFGHMVNTRAGLLRLVGGDADLGWGDVFNRDADLAKPATRPFTPAVKTLGDQISFLTMHDTYHVGQLGYVRKALGWPGVVG